MKYITAKEAAKKWGLTPRSVQLHCEKGNVPGVNLLGKSWQIPESAPRPERKPRMKGLPSSVLALLKAEKRGRISGGLYHRLQIDLAYNSNHIEGSRLTHEQTRWIFETKTIGEIASDVPVDDIIEAANHFRAVDIVIESAGAALTERYVKDLHRQLKSGTTDSRKEWFAVGDYKRLDNVVGDMETCPAKDVPREMARLLAWWKAADKSLGNLVDLHVRFEQIHPFQDGNGRVGRLILLKECLKYGITPFVIAENFKQFYYMGLQDWRRGSHARLIETCRAGQDVFILGLRQFGHVKLAEKEEAGQKASSTP
ncbi:MAG: Fic family protein [Kiritimatiellae bacterium]|nr:Fic family protein [Kiritimatiellia bacterium]